ncbi:MAG: hypothetical protein K2G90_10640 [Muribaculaceae bacterium]|nr:hypothetical protein [Muribaculaceae bacterium]
MKHEFFLLILGCLLLGVLSACGPDKESNEPQPVTPTPPVSFENSLTYFTAQGMEFSAIEYLDVTLCEVHSDIADFELTCNPPEGYKIYLKKLSQKDNADFYVYRIVCDMSKISTSTSSNEKEKIEIKYSISGTGYTDGKWGNKTYENSLVIFRYYLPEEMPEKIYHNWYLAEHSVVDNLTKAEFKDRYTFVETRVSSQYGVANTPLIINYFGMMEDSYVDEYGNLITKKDVNWDTSCKTDLPGWVVGEHIILKTELKDSQLVYYSYPDDFGSSVYVILDDKLLTMKGEYMKGELLKIHYYTFFRRTAE